jgi:hypothetical protein
VIWHQEDKEWGEVEEEDRIHQAGEGAWVEAAVRVPRAIASAPTADTRYPMKGGFRALKSNVPSVVPI